MKDMRRRPATKNLGFSDGYVRAREASELASAASPRNADSMHKLLTKLKEEFFALLPPTIFFLSL